MTIKEYLDYPNGRNVRPQENAALKVQVSQELKTDYGKYGITFRTYKSEGGGRLIFHCKVPSRTKDMIFYDVIIMVGVADSEQVHSSIELLDFAAFSNSPAFLYRCAQAFQRNNMLCNFLAKKMDAKILGIESMRNPEAKIVYERTLYAALKTLSNRRILQKTYETMVKKAQTIDPYILATRVQSQEMLDMLRAGATDTKEIAAQKAATADRKKRKAERKTAPMNPYDGVRVAMKTQKVGRSKMVRAVRTDGATKKVPKIKSTKKL